MSPSLEKWVSIKRNFETIENISIIEIETIFRSCKDFEVDYL